MMFLQKVFLPNNLKYFFVSCTKTSTSRRNVLKKTKKASDFFYILFKFSSVFVSPPLVIYIRLFKRSFRR